VRLARITPLRGAAAAITVAALIQLVPVKRDNPPVRTEVTAPREVKAVLERSCYDCHSNRTVWPWYSHVAPVSWLVASDVHKGRHEVNFTDWPFFDQDDQDHILEHIVKQMEHRAMPLSNYLLMHPKARLTDEERRMLIDWARVE
jgi:uncharacterized membrane protein